MKVKLRLTPSKRLGVNGVEGDEIEVTREQAEKLLAARVIRGPLPKAELNAIPRESHQQVTSRKVDK